MPGRELPFAEEKKDRKSFKGNWQVESVRFREIVLLETWERLARQRSIFPSLQMAAPFPYNAHAVKLRGVI